MSKKKKVEVINEFTPTKKYKVSDPTQQFVIVSSRSKIPRSIVKKLNVIKYTTKLVHVLDHPIKVTGWIINFNKTGVDLFEMKFAGSTGF